MTDTQRTKADWLVLIDETHATWSELVRGAGRVGFDTPGVGGVWTFTQVAGHLNGWRIRTVQRLEAAARGTEPTPPPWPADLGEETEAQTDATNRWIDDHYASKPATDILVEAEEQFRRMRAATEAIPEADLLTSGRYTWLDGHPLSAVIQGSHEHLAIEHEADIRAWLAAHPA